MEITGKIIRILPLQSGQGRNGEWKKQDFVLETNEQYPKKVCFTVWGDKIDLFNIQMGDDLTVSITIESREYNEKWYTNIQAWKVDKANNTIPQFDEAAMPFPSTPEYVSSAPSASGGSELTASSPVDDLPF